MCHQRLAEGEAPACVQACPTEAIRIIKVPVDQTTAAHPALLCDISITRPSTRYVGRTVPDSAIAADRDARVPEHAHWPLILMLVLTQAGIGLVLTSGRELPMINIGNLLFFAGMTASVFHLGKPLKAWRFFLGLRTSWLSREILAFSMFAPIPPILLAFALLPRFPELALPAVISPLLPFAHWVTATSAWGVGLLAVFTSVMIYHDTGRALWRLPLGAVRFFGTVASFAALGLLLPHPTPAAALVFAMIVLLKMVPESRLLRRLDDADAPWSPELHSARLQQGPLGPCLRSRFIFGLLAIALAMVNPWLSLPALLLAELLERQLFFQSVYAPKMAGNFGPKNAH